MLIGILVVLPIVQAFVGSQSADCPALTWKEVVADETGTLIYTLTDECAELFECPKGLYCAAGAYETNAGMNDAAEYFAEFWWPSFDGRCIVINGFVNGSYAYACECGYGMWCPLNTALPRFVPKEYYSRRPDTIKKCKEGHYCKEGSVFGIRCNALQNCPRGSSRPANSSGPLVAFVVLTFLTFIVFKIIESSREKSRTKADQEMHDYLDFVVAANNDDNEKKTTTQVVPIMNDEKKDGIRIEFHDIWYTLPNGITIMRGVSGTLEPGRVAAIMGASGAGKTTLMNLISGKVKKTGGSILVNGKETINLSNTISRVAFVPQEDIMHRHLTVLENITFSAQLRLPRTWPNEMKKSLIISTLVQLNLNKIEHSIIGDEYQRGISGGQRKRVNVALELVADPKILFLDEPTSGLDSVSATELVKLLRSITETNQLTVAAVIHSPGPSAFLTFHDFILLQTGGRPIYVGEMSKTEAYFASIGFKRPEDSIEPLADYVMICTSGKIEPDYEIATLRLNDEDTEWNHLTSFHILWHQFLGIPPPLNDDDTALKDTVRAQEKWLIYFKDIIFSWFVEYPNLLIKQFCPQNKSDPQRPTPNSFEIFLLCLKRAVKQQYVSFKSFFISTIVVFFIIGNAIASLSGGNLNVLGGYPPDICLKQYPQLRATCLDLQQNSYTNALQFSGFILIASAAAISASTFGKEQTIYWREAASNLNTPAYFFAKVFADIPICFLSALSVTAGFSTGFISPMPFPQLLAGYILYTIFGFLSGYFLSFLLPYSSVALAGVGWAVFWSLLMGGTTIVMSDNRESRWFWTLSLGRWVNEAFFYGTTVYPYEKVRQGPEKGQDLFDMNRRKQTLLFFLTYGEAAGYGALVCLIFLFINLFVITATKLDKKK